MVPTHTTQIHIKATMAALTEVPEVNPSPPIAVRQATMMVPPRSNIGRRPVFSTIKEDIKTIPMSRMLLRCRLTVRAITRRVAEAYPSLVDSLDDDRSEEWVSQAGFLEKD